MDKKMENRREVIIFLENIKRLREEKGYSKREMAKRLKIGLYSINKIESGELPPRLSIDVLDNIEKEFKIYPADMLKK